MESSRHSLGLGQGSSTPRPTALVVLGQTSLCLCSSGLRDPSPVGRYTSCQAPGGGGCHFWSSARGTANKDAIIRGGGGTSPFAQLCEQTGETIFIPLCC